MPVWAMLGLLAGLGLTVARISRAASYLSDDPETCMNCHVMAPQYATWQHGSHANVATCNDCHVPHTSFASHYAFKARDGLRHSAIFTFRLEPQVIQLSAAAVPVVESNCRRCHARVIADVHVAEPDSAGPRCWDCHRDTPHGRGRSLSATPSVMRPQLPAVDLEDPGIRIGGRPRNRTAKENGHGE